MLRPDQGTAWNGEGRTVITDLDTAKAIIAELETRVEQLIAAQEKCEKENHRLRVSVTISRAEVADMERKIGRVAELVGVRS